ncbi:acyltransferase [Ilyobacter polytropus]|uniref:Transferase hexapeptide repeat containing protein n=1 Tax=Ilyobacter polytropus (strain ATCC 51220 / DSM 2926 / LMG 16218 / CuHBu1) TaxID=572544 RepID=E3HD31_ILYPC|nr:galactoside O-acetyltransferase [Ilyobacter polytropus]ADO84507.1 transferase hexapeptide repeat containing protein [Ilyobacter polytropus DSM 2926]
MSFYNKEELKGIGLKSFGENVLISRKTSIYGAENISIGDNVRIDDFCILSGVISIGSHIHIAAGNYIFAGNAGIVLKDFVGLSSRCSIYAVSDDYTGAALIGPIIPEKYRRIKSRKVILEKYTVLGTGTILLPGAYLEEGVAVGANSLVYKKLKGWSIYSGSPAIKIRDRKKELLEKVKEFENDY